VLDIEIKHHTEIMTLVPVKPVVILLTISVGTGFYQNSKCFTHAENEYTHKFKELIFACHLSTAL